MATAEDLRNFQIHQRESGADAGTINGAVSALRFLYTVTLRRRDLAHALVATRRPDKMREVLSVEGASQLLEAAPGIKYKAALGVPYGAGLRVSEVAHLQVDDIDSERMLIRVEQGKGARDRNAMLSPPRTSARDDARDPRVHPPLPDARPASRLPSHPPLRPARRLHTQGHAWLGLARHLLHVATPSEPPPEQTQDYRPPCPCCGGHMLVIEAFPRWRQPRAPPPPTMPIPIPAP
jgi:integrase